MDKIDIVRKAYNISNTEAEEDQYYADDFQATDERSEAVLDKDAWLKMRKVFLTSVPDAGWVMEEIHQEGDEVLATGHFTGTFKKDFDLTSMNMGIIKATGKPLKFPEGTSRVSFKGDQIVRNHSLGTGSNDSLAEFLAVFKAG